MVVGIRYVLLRILSTRSQHSDSGTVEFVAVRVGHDTLHALLIRNESSWPEDDVDTDRDEEAKNI